MKGFTRPDAAILEESAIIPKENLVSPAPTHFTHQLKQPEAYYYKRGKKPAGEFPAGTKVLLLEKDGNHCRVVDEQGLSVEVAGDSLKEL
jgi:hypothetical protein